MMVRSPFLAKTNLQNSLSSRAVWLWAVVALCTCLNMLGTTSVALSSEWQEGNSVDSWELARSEFVCHVKDLLRQQSELSLQVSSQPNVGFPRYARGGCQPCHGPRCKAPIDPCAPTFALPTSVEESKRMASAHLCAKSLIYIDSFRRMMPRSSSAVRGQLDVLERPPRVS